MLFTAFNRPTRAAPSPPISRSANVGSTASIMLNTIFRIPIISRNTSSLRNPGCSTSVRNIPAVCPTAARNPATGTIASPSTLRSRISSTSGSTSNSIPKLTANSTRCTENSIPHIATGPPCCTPSLTKYPTMKPRFKIA